MRRRRAVSQAGFEGRGCRGALLRGGNSRGSSLLLSLERRKFGRESWLLWVPVSYRDHRFKNI